MECLLNPAYLTDAKFEQMIARENSQRAQTSYVAGTKAPPLLIPFHLLSLIPFAAPAQKSES